MNTAYGITCAGLLSIAATSAAAQTLDTVIVTSSRLDDSTPPEDIVRLDGTMRLDTFSALRRLPGINAFSNGGFGGSTYIAVRGGEPNFTLVLLDGIRVTDPSNAAGGAFDLAQIDPAILRAIKVSPFGGSAIYGPDALSGIVQIETISPQSYGAPRLALSATGQTQQAWAFSAVTTNQWDSGGIAASFAARDTGRLTKQSTLRRDVGHFKLEQTVGEGDLKVIGLFGETDRQAFPEDGGGVVFAESDMLEERKTNLALVGVSYRYAFNDDLSLTSTGSFSRQESVSDTPAIPSGLLAGVPARRDDTAFTRWEGATFLQYRPRDNFGMVLGAGHLEEEGVGQGELDFGFPVATAFSEDRSVTSVFAETAVSPTNRLDLFGALRWDNSSTQSSRFTGRGAISYELTNQLVVGAGYANNYKLPSIFATSFPLIANPDLRPETGKSFEVSLRSDFDNGGYASIRSYFNQFSDLIDFDPVAFTNVNRASVETRGIEFSLSYPLTKRLSVRGNVATLDFESSGDLPLRSRPRTTAGARLDWRPHNRISVYAVWDHSAGSFSSSIPTGLVRLGGYHRIDLGAAWVPAPTWRASIDVANLVDERYSFAVGVPEPGLSVSATIEKRF